VEACLIVGLGNPGRTYAATRHNAGFMVVDEIARRHGAAFDPGRGEFERASVGTEEGRIHLLKPTTYMNGSGSAVREAVEQLGVFPERVLVVLDDFQIPLGSLRMRPGGSDGGHNGLASVLDMLGTIAIARERGKKGFRS
jgi:PTH1 family peptidyl-tRNA hydrolase